MQFIILPKYAEFLKNESLKQLVREELDALRQLDVPLLRNLSMMPEAALLDWLAQREEGLLNSMMAGTAAEWERERKDLWNADAVPGIPKGFLQSSDLILFHAAQRVAFTRFVGRFTTNQGVRIDLLIELEEYFSSVLTAALRSYRQIHSSSKG